MVRSKIGRLIGLSQWKQSRALSWILFLAPTNHISTLYIDVIIHLQAYKYAAKYTHTTQVPVLANTNSCSVTFVSDPPAHNLGITFDPHVSFSNHTSNLFCAYSCGVLVLCSLFNPSSVHPFSSLLFLTKLKNMFQLACLPQLDV